MRACVQFFNAFFILYEIPNHSKWYQRALWNSVHFKLILQYKDFLHLDYHFSILNASLSITSLYLKHFSILNISLSQTPHYPKHLFIPNISPSQISLHLKHFSISNIPPSQTSLHLKHSTISNISLSQTFLYLKHPSISNVPPSQTSVIANTSLTFLSVSNAPLSRSSCPLFLEY